MDPIFSRTARIIDEKGIECLQAKTVAVFGIGGVGSYAAEALVRAGVGHLIFIDKDDVDITNLNRQLVADLTTVGKNKAEVMVSRAHLVNPACDAKAMPIFYRPGDEDFIRNLHADYIIDVGPDGGTAGGEVVFAGTPRDMAEHGDTITARYLRKSLAD